MKYLHKKLKSDKERIRKAASYAALVICPILTFYLFDLYTHNPFTSMDGKTRILNILFYEFTGLMLFGILKYLRLALMLQSALFMIAGLINYYVLSFRSAPIMPWDIFSLSTAASVAGNYNYALEGKTVLVIIGFLLLLFAESRIKVKTPGKISARLGLMLLPFLCLIGYTDLIQSDSFVASFGLYDKLFTPTAMTRLDGNIVAFIMEMKYLDVEKPEGYSEKETAELYEELKGEEYIAAVSDPGSLRRPNIIVIMDESFSDLSVLGKFEVSQDYMPFLHRIMQEGAENTITGYANVSVLGGNTANSEYEFLSGHTMAYLPQGSVAYQQYVKKKMPTLVSYLKDLGYSAQAVHPYYADGWERSRVYPLLGFDRFLDKNDFFRPRKIRKYISDESCFDKIIQLYEEKEEQEPLFVFAVTMQNHGGYDEEFTNFKPDVAVENTTSRALPKYLSLVKKTDGALEKLVNYFKEADEDTVILFFGDHQPASYVSNPVFKIQNIDPNSLNEEQNLLKYKVPYMIFSNYDTALESREETSLNYLAIDLLEACGLPLPPLQTYLKTLRESYPVISALRPAEDVTYQSLQYYMLFDGDFADGAEE